MSTGNNNDIDNGNFLSENINVNENNVGNNGRKKKYERSKAVDIIALDLAEKLQSPNSYEFTVKSPGDYSRPLYTIISNRL